MTIDEVGVDRPGRVRNIGRVHPHRAPHPAVGGGLILAGKQPRECLLLEIEVAAILLEARIDLVGVHETPVAQHQHMLAVGSDRVDPGRIDDDRAEMPHRFLQPRMAVVPIGPRLADRELIDEGLAGLDARKADARHAIILKRQQQAVPMDRRVLGERVGNRKADVLAFLEANQRAGDAAVDGDGMARAAADAVHRVTDAELDVFAGQHIAARRQAACAAARPARESSP